MKQNKNPLVGKVFFNKEGVSLRDDIKFGGEMNPKVSPREWLYLMYDALGKTPRRIKKDPLENFVWEVRRDKHIGSRATQWRIRNSLIKKGYL